MHCEEIRARVRDTYAAVEDTGGAVARRLYSADDLAQVPSIAADGALGVADHLRHADIKPGETILDIGCGSGLDTILAARRTAPTGRLLALDFLPAMLERTSAAAAEARLLNVETVQAEMEAIPLSDDSIDQIISNGVINLSSRKARVFAECARVLRTGGKLCVADMTVDEEQLPEQVLAHPAAWTSCTTGALTERDFARKLEKECLLGAPGPSPQQTPSLPLAQDRRRRCSHWRCSRPGTNPAISRPGCIATASRGKRARGPRGRCRRRGAVRGHRRASPTSPRPRPGQRVGADDRDGDISAVQLCAQRPRRGSVSSVRGMSSRVMRGSYLRCLAALAGTLDRRGDHFRDAPAVEGGEGAASAGEI